ncbi:DNA-directed RNA polymerase II subunit RPB4 [Anaeromyces robustus]|uniref:DNA-directed RNA polymerase II subunit RPB4 n=1 Tax=Anaeromyces robustus TaxID=1754192 RepID=A0A1Y1XAX0_9FUNG|nr:DNA-directed RNA polymerase II subunit RPB4 [Anaeromyces robustus]|eukprot:ORX82879.1 DNA-directed RNA polymerase II subunit RPB4 [Anaeromyces robustus]
MASVPTENERINRGQLEEDDASKLKFGEEFQNTQCLFIAEVKVLMEVQKHNRLSENDMGESSLSEVFQKTMNYCNQFGKYQNHEAVKEMRKIFPVNEFKQFEVAQLVNLSCETAEEAKALIPSLSRIQDDRLQELLEEMHSLKVYS